MKKSVFSKLTVRLLTIPFVVLAGLYLVTSFLLAEIGKQVPQLSLSDGARGGGVITLSSQAEPVIDISSWNASGQAKITLYKADKAFLLNYLRHTTENKQILSSVDTTNMQQVAQFSEYIGSGATRVNLPLDASGIWYLDISGNGVANDAVIVRSTFGGVIKSMGDAYVVWSQDFKNYRSLGQVSVKTYDLTDNPVEIGTGTTNDSGVAQLPFSVKADIALLEKDGQVALIPVNMKYFNTGYSYVRFSQIGDQLRYYLFTDRPIYKPGDTLYYKGLVRQDDDARYSIPTGTARVVMYRGWDNKDVVFEKLLPVSSDGSIASEYAIPDTLATGSYTLSMQLQSDKADGSWREDGRVTLDVEEYRKPEYFLEVQAPKVEAYVGEPMAVTIKGAYFSGQPLTSGDVTYKITSRPMYQPTTRESLDWMLNDDYQYGYWWGSEDLSAGSVGFDTTGTAQIELPLSPTQSDGKLRIFAVEAEFMDQTGNPVQARKNILVYPAKWAIYRDDSGWQAGSVNKPHTIPLIVVPHDSVTKVNDLALTAYIKRESWVKKTVGSSTTYEREEENLPQQTVVTDRTGKAKLTFTPTKEGYYTITVSGEDATGRQVRNEFGAWISNDAGYWYYGSYAPSLTLSADRETYQPSEAAKLTIHSEIPDRDVFLVLQRARVDRFQVVRLNGSTGSISLPLTDADMPNTFARIYSFDPTELVSNRAELKVSAQKKRVTVSLQPDRTYYGPGDTVNLTVKTTDYKGQPMPAEVAVWTVDKALFELSTDVRKNIFEAFWSDRYESAQDGNSLEHINFYSAERGGGCFVAGTQVLMADGSYKSIEKIKPGEYVRTRTSETDPTLIRAKVSGTHTATEAGYLIINKTLKVTPNHILWVNDTWKTASQVQMNDRLVAADGSVVNVDSVEWFAQKAEVYNLTVENQHTYFADGLWVHNQKGDVRSVLKDAAYWNPTVRTDGSGTAKITFKLPDNLTTWVISGVASTTATAVGETKVEVITQKEVVLRPVVPNILRVGDVLQLSALLHNFGEVEKTFTTSLDYPGAQVDQATQSGILVAGKGGIEQLYWKVQPSTPDSQAKATFTAKANEGDSGDAIAQPLPIVPFGYTEEYSVAGFNSTQLPISIPADADDSYSKMTLDLSPTMLGTLPGAMQYLIEYPYGCVEQTTSRFVPAVIAKANSAIFADAFKDKNITEIVDRGVSRIELLQNTDGGWGWSHYGVSDPFITAYVVEYLVAAKNIGASVPQNIFDSAQTFLSQTSWESERTVLNTYALQQLGDEKGKVEVPVLETFSPDLLAYALMVNYKAGNKNPDTNGMTILLNKIERDGELASLPAGKSSWFGSRDASTALALRALTFAQADRTTTLPLARYLLERRTKQYWSNTFATAQVAQALVDFTKAGGDLTPAYSYTVSLNNTVVSAGTVDATTKFIKPITINVADAKKGNLTIDKKGEGNLYSSVAVSAFRTDRKTTAQSQGISIEREYVSGKGSEYYPSVGDTVSVKLKINKIPTGTDYLVVEDYLPAGMVPINTNLKNEGNQMDDYYYGGYWYGSTEERTKKDGAVLLLSGLQPGQRTVTYEARVIASGEFAAPPAIVADMYNSQVRAHTAVAQVKITNDLQKDPRRVVATFFDDVGNFPAWLKKHMRELLGAAFLLLGLGVTMYLHKRRLRAQKLEDGDAVKPPETPVV